MAEDVAQLAADLSGREDPRCAELELQLQKSRKELELLRQGGAGNADASLRKELEAAEEKTKEQVKKLKQLATVAPRDVGLLNAFLGSQH